MFFCKKCKPQGHLRHRHFDVQEVENYINFQIKADLLNIASALAICHHNLEEFETETAKEKFLSNIRDVRDAVQRRCEVMTNLLGDLDGQEVKELLTVINKTKEGWLDGNRTAEYALRFQECVLKSFQKKSELVIDHGIDYRQVIQYMELHRLTSKISDLPLTRRPSPGSETRLSFTALDVKRFLPRGIRNVIGQVSVTRDQQPGTNTDNQLPSWDRLRQLLDKSELRLQQIASERFVLVRHLGKANEFITVQQNIIDALTSENARLSRYKERILQQFTSNSGIRWCYVESFCKSLLTASNIQH